MAIKNGKTYGSKASAYRVLVRPELKKWSPDGMVLIDTIPPLTAEFGTHGGEFKFHNHLTGSEDTGALINGHFFDSAAQAEEKGWSQEEHDMVVKVLDQICAKTPELCWPHSAPKAAAPWPTYDSTPFGKIPELAATLGLVAEAIVYEEQNKNRSTVLDKLRESLPTAEEPAPDDLVAA